MKKLIVLLFVSILFQNVFCQENDFKIGIQADRITKLNGSIVPTVKVNGEYSSVFGILSEDGFNLIRSYDPFMYISRQNFKNFVELIGNHQMQCTFWLEKWFKPTSNHSNSGFNQYQINDGINYFLNFDEAFNEVVGNNLYEDIIWGVHLAGESDGEHPFPTKDIRPSCGFFYIQNGNDCVPDINHLHWKLSAVPPQNVNDAFLHYNTLKTDGEHNSNLKLINGQVFHRGYINDYAHIVFNKSDYFKNDYRGDVQLEASYYAWQFQDYFHDDIWEDQQLEYDKMYLGKFLSIDYEKNYYDNIQVEIEVSTAEHYKNVDPEYCYITCTNPNITNYNHVWFQAYTSIIHGAKGVWFWKLESMWSNSAIDLSRKTIFEGTDDLRFQRQNFPTNYEKYLGNLAKELRYLKEIGVLSTDENSILYTKTTSADKLGILPNCSTYLPKTLTYTNARDLYDVKKFPSTHTFPENYHYTDEFYGLRYTLRTNGEDIFMIISNPNPVAIITPVSLNFCGVYDIDGAYLYFENNEGAVTGTGYKTTRDAGIDWKAKTVRDKQYLPATNNKISLSFGPLDVHVLKLKLSAGWNDHILLNQSQKVQLKSDLNCENDMLYYVWETGHISRMSKTQNGGWDDCWIYKPTWPLVKQGTGIDVGSEWYAPIYYVGIDNKFHNIYFDGTTWQNSTITSRCYDPGSTTEVHYDNNGKAFFVDKYGMMSVAYNNGQDCDWVCASAQTVKSGTGFDVGPEWNDPIYYIGSVDGDIHRIIYNGTWQHTKLTNCTMKPRNDSEVHYGYGMGFFVREDGHMCAFYPCGESTWCCDWVHPASAPLVKAGTGFAVERVWNNPIYYIGTDDNIYKIFYNGGWTYTQITDDANCGAGAKGDMDLIYSNNRIFYVGKNDGKIHSVKDMSAGGILKSTNAANPNSPLNYFPDYVPERMQEMQNILIQVSPTVTSDFITISANNAIKKINVMDVRGAVMQTFDNVDNFEYSINLNPYCNGLYFIQVITNNGNTTKKVIKQ
ncbi:MAG: T9SS type A sorting domain-containing protein [Bacteroidales bacterium]|nr:T9SS type A sorting domain-containing protein [Bacteroidales bacterium]